MSNCSLSLLLISHISPVRFAKVYLSFTILSMHMVRRNVRAQLRGGGEGLFLVTRRGRYVAREASRETVKK